MKVPMVKIISITLIMFLSSSCLKKSTSQNSESQIVDLLNQNQAESALERINQELKSSPNDELLYLKASALSMQAGVDVYALFPLLKLKIFDVAISQWSQNREFQRKAQEQRTSTILTTQDISAQKEAQGHKTYSPLVGAQLDYKIVYFNQIYSRPEVSGCLVSFTLLPFEKKFKTTYLWHFVELTSQLNCEELLSKNIIGKDLTDIAFDVPAQLNEEIRKYISEVHKEQWEKHNKDVGIKSNYIKILGNLWTLIDLIPILKKIPKIKNEDFKKLEEAQSLLAKIKELHNDKSDPLGNKAKKQLIMLSALKMVAHFQNAFNLDLIKSPNDFLCLSKENAAQELVESEKDALYIINAIEDPEIIGKNQEFFNDIKNKYEKIIQAESDHPELKEEHIRKINEEIEAGRIKYCEQQ